MSDELAIAEEGCLSLPRVTMDVERPLHARFTGRDVDGEPVAIEASGLEARVLQHEIDHLDGVLILDRTERKQRKAALRALRAGESYHPPVEDEDDPGEELREPRTDACRTVYLGTSDFAATVLRRLADSPHTPALVVTPPDSRQGARPQGLAAAGRRAGGRAGDRPAAGGERQRRGGAGADPRGASPRRSWSAPSAS